MAIQDAPAFEMIEPPDELRPFYGQADGSSYIAPFVDEFGVAHSTAYDSQIADLAAETAARRFKGQQLFSSLMEGGATREEAFRLAAPDLLFGDTRSLLKTLPKITEPFTPSFRDVEGGRIFQRGPNSAQFLPKKNPALPPEVVARRQIVRDELQALRRAAADPITGKMVDKKRISELEKEFVDLAGGQPEVITGAGFQPPPVTVMREGPEGISIRREVPMSPAAQRGQPNTSPFKEGEIVRNKKDGKRYRIVNGEPIPL